MNIAFTRNARALFEDERRRQGSSVLGIQIGFVYGCGGAGFRAVFRTDPQGSHAVDVDGVRIALDAESRAQLDGMIIDWEEGPEPGFVLRHPDAVLVEFC
jgi:Fe-S cluster assembly iron-binding protein IscA